MGTSFFKGGPKPPAITGSNIGQMSRGLNAGQFAARGAGIGAQKALQGALAANNAAIKAHKPIARSAAYPKGPSV